MRILVTGGAGFIGSCLVRHLVLKQGWRVLNLDSLTYAGHLASLESVESSPLYQFAKIDICDSPRVSKLFQQFRPEAVMHLAAESHVDRSVDGPGAFIETNVLGTFSLLQASRAYWLELNDAERSKFRFVHVSTDEVFGSLGVEGLFHEGTPYAPSSPYSASKAAADHLVKAWHTTYGLPTIVTNCSNNYGPYQLPEKLIPLMVLNALSSRNLPVYGSGRNVRDWLHVDDHVSGLLAALKFGEPGQTYNFGGGSERRNIDVVSAVCHSLDRLRPLAGGSSHLHLITHVEDRPGHDLRYAVSADRARRELGWRPTRSFEEGLESTVRWYLENIAWCAQVSGNHHAEERIGLGDTVRLAS